MIKDWKSMSNEDKKNEVPKIGELRNEGYTWSEIGEFYGISAESIRDYYKDHKPKSSRKSAESIITGEIITPNRKAEMIAILAALFVQLILVISICLCVIDFAVYKQTISLVLMTLSLILIWINYVLELQILKNKITIGDKYEYQRDYNKSTDI